MQIFKNYINVKIIYIVKVICIMLKVFIYLYLYIREFERGGFFQIIFKKNILIGYFGRSQVVGQFIRKRGFESFVER